MVTLLSFKEIKSLNELVYISVINQYVINLKDIIVGKNIVY
jgi:hypothetical protein